MGNSAPITAELNRLMDEQERSVAWVARVTRLPYKRVLAEVRNRTTPIKLSTAIDVAAALGTTLPALIERAGEDILTNEMPVAS